MLPPFKKKKTMEVSHKTSQRIEDVNINIAKDKVNFGLQMITRDRESYLIMKKGQFTKNIILQ